MSVEFLNMENALDNCYKTRKVRRSIRHLKQHMNLFNNLINLYISI